MAGSTTTLSDVFNGKIAGYAYALPYRERSAYRYTVEDSIYVAPDAGRQGVGTALVRHAEAWGVARGCTELKIETQDINVPACRLYAARGCRLAWKAPSASDNPRSIRAWLASSSSW